MLVGLCSSSRRSAHVLNVSDVSLIRCFFFSFLLRSESWSFSHFPVSRDGRPRWWWWRGGGGGLGSSISLRYPNIYAVMHINPCGAAAFWVKNAAFLGRYSSSIQCLSTATHRDLSSAVTLHNNTHKFQCACVCVCVCPWKSLESSIWVCAPAGKIWAAEILEFRSNRNSKTTRGDLSNSAPTQKNRLNFLGFF